jgi:hypothetical protein
MKRGGKQVNREGKAERKKCRMQDSEQNKVGKEDNDRK